MQKYRSRLLIALALLGVLALGVSGARANPISPQRASEDGPGLTWYSSSSDPSNAGEPDSPGSSLPQHSGSAGSSSSMSVASRGAVGSGPAAMTISQVIRMARVFLMARYLGIAP